MFTRLLAAVLAVCLCAAPARAFQEAPLDADPAAGERRAELARTYLELVQGDQMEQMVAAMVGGLFPLGLSQEDDAARLREAVGNVALETAQLLIEANVPIYAGTFTEAELEALVAFWSSQTGRSIRQKLIDIAPASMAATQRLMPEIARRLEAQACREVDCDSPDTARGLEIPRPDR